MKIHPQTIYNGAEAEYIVLPVNEYKKMLSAIEEFQDIQEIRSYQKLEAEVFPLKLVTALAAGINPIKAYREYRKLSQSELANRIGVTKQYISQLENGERSGSTRTLAAIASALQLDLQDIVS